MVLPDQAPTFFRPEDLEEIYAHDRVGGWAKCTEEEITEYFMHPASPTDNPGDKMFIFKREKHPSNQAPVNYEGRDNPNGGAGFDFLNKQAYDQYWKWVLQMHHNDAWKGEEYDVMPIGREAEVLAKYCLAYWAHAVQDGTMALSLHSEFKKLEKYRTRYYPDGYVLVNGHEVGIIGGGSVESQLRDIVPALLGAFNVPVEEIPHNLDTPFPHRNFWDIPGGKLIAVPENYTENRAGVISVRLIPDTVVEHLKLVASLI